MTQTTNTPDAEILGFNAPPDVDREKTGLPRAEVVFLVNQVTIAEGALEDQLWAVQCALPANYYFILVDVWAQVQGVLPADVAAWEDRCTLGLLDGSGVRVGWVPMTGGAVCQYKVMGPEHGMLKSMIKGGTVQTFIWCNPDIGDPEVTGSFYARFLMYDVNQRHNVMVHNAIPVR